MPLQSFLYLTAKKIQARYRIQIDDSFDAFGMFQQTHLGMGGLDDIGQKDL